jgi:hypothetical protein
MSDPTDESADENGLGPLQVIGSVLAAALGIQSSKNRERDFKRGRIGIFLAAGITFTFLFVAAVMTAVTLVLNSSGH